MKLDRNQLAKPATGNALSVAAGLCFFLAAMMLPLVGPAGSRVDHAAQNKAAFLGILLSTLVLAAMAVASKLELRKSAGGPLPWFSILVGTACILAFVVLLFDGFAI